MKLFDEVIQEVLSLMDSKKELQLNHSWPKGDQNQLLFRSDTALELGCDCLPGKEGILFTNSSSLVKEDSVYLIGSPIESLKGNSPYARIVFVRVDDTMLGNGNALYQSLRRIDYTRYHIYPKDCMLRISSMNQKESLSIGKKAIKDKITFNSLGMEFIEAYKENKGVLAVSIVFITDPDFPYAKLEEYLTKAENITKALDHLLNKVQMDCHTCGLKKVCEEVEELCKEDFIKN